MYRNLRHLIHNFTPLIILLTALGALPLSASPILRLSTAAISTTAIVGSNPAAQTVQAHNIGDGTLNLSVSTNSTWLKPTLSPAQACVAPLPGSCAPILVTMNTSSFAPGTYTDFFTVSDPNAVDSPQAVSVTVEIGGVPNTAVFYVTPNGGTASTFVETQKAVTGQTSTADGTSWLAFTSAGAGSYAFFISNQIKVTSQAGQAEGSYKGTVALSGSSVPADNSTVAVTMNVTSQPIANFSPSTATFQLQQGGAAATQTVTLANSGQGTLAVTGTTATTASGVSWLAVTNSGNTLTLTATPASLGPGAYQGTVTVASNAANSSLISLPVQLEIAGPTGPIITFGGVVNNATFRQEPVSQGDITALFGTQLSSSPTAVKAQNIPLPTELDNGSSKVRVLVNGVAVPLYYAAAGQIDFQMPYETPVGLATVAVERDGQVGNMVSAQVVATLPRILPIGVGDYGIVQNLDGTFAIPTTPGIATRPAKIGETVVFYLIGAGQTVPAAVTGAGAPLTPLEQIMPPYSVTLGGGFGSTPIDVQPVFLGLTPYFVGLYQLNVTLPPNSPVGVDIPVGLRIGTTVSNYVGMSIVAQ